MFESTTIRNAALAIHVCINHFIMRIHYCERYYTEYPFVVVVSYILPLFTGVNICMFAIHGACALREIPLASESIRYVSPFFLWGRHLKRKNSLYYVVWLYKARLILDCFTGSQ
jgi:hypothetical protein